MSTFVVAPSIVALTP